MYANLLKGVTYFVFALWRYMTEKIIKTSKVYVAQLDNRCGVETVTKTGIITNTKQYTVVLPQHRIKPVEPSWNPTPLGEYKTEYRAPGLLKLGPLHTGDTYCPPSTPRYTTYFKDSGTPNVPRITFDAGGWNQMYLDEIRALASDQSGLIAEIDETAKLFLEFLRIASDISSCITRPFGRRCSRALKSLRPKSWTDVPAAVLMHNFAINPLVRSVYDGYEKFLDPAFSLDKRVKFRFVQDEPYDNGSVSGARRLVVKTSAMLRMRDNGLLSAAFNPGNPVEWAWERIPFSFVIDWMMPVGSFIAAFGTLSRVEKGIATRTFKERCNGTTYVPPYGEIYSRNMFVGRYYRRDVVGLPTIPDLFQYKPAKSFTTLTSALSLLAVVRNQKF